VKIAIRVDQDQPMDEAVIRAHINSYSKSIRVTSISHADYGIGASWGVGLVDIEAIGSALLAAYGFFKLPHSIKQLPKQLEAWKELCAEMRKFLSHIETKESVASFPVQAIIIDAIDYVILQNPDAIKLELHSLNEIGSCSGGLNSDQVTYENSSIVYYNLVFRVEFKGNSFISFQLWDSQKRLLSLTNANWDPRISSTGNKDIRRIGRIG